MSGSRAALTFAALLLGLCGCSGGGGDASAGSGGAMSEAAGAMTLSGVGFSTPESVLHDTTADVYLVSNVVGQPDAKDGDGFISRVSPEGQVAELRWIDGAADGVELNAPKGMAILGDSLYVADIDCVRVFVRTTGSPAGSICFQGASFLNDVAVDANGSLYVTDTGVRSGAEGLEPAGTDAVYQFTRDGHRTTIARGSELGGPNGIAFGPRGGFVATLGSGEIYQLGPDGARVHVLNDPQLEGIVFLPDGGFLYSSWGAQAVYEVTAAGQKVTVVEGVESPADIGYDARRGRVLIPVFNLDEVWIREVPDAR